MNRFIIVDGLPFLYANGKAYSVRWDDNGFTVGSEVELASEPSVTYSELSIKAKCAGCLDSIGVEPGQEDAPDEQGEATSNEGKADESDDDSNEDGDAGVEPGQEDAPDEQGTDAESVSDELENMTVDNLKQYASDNGIALNGARTKPAIIEAIKSASKE